ncbi:secreted salivary gland peptide, putative [Ixodes scapularis]|uniref:Secreted salivary gland peptide, putative n=1 Tax=Ixodes scapularis TaxID=6945 RepID=B7Q8A1_IXOSC|nr:secreted salivary gland peptide, putative [Ixodes scapularis]|eukprot:XP_002412325.1 secreted salivary gland peptide, putative [Ixodes scapularis]
MRTPTNVFYTLVAFAFMWKVSLAVPPYSDVEIVDGNILKEQNLVLTDQSISLQMPVQTFALLNLNKGHAPEERVTLQKRKPYNCEIVRGTGPYPNCCYRTNCRGKPQYPRYRLGNDYRYPGK